MKNYEIIKKIIFIIILIIFFLIICILLYKNTNKKIENQITNNVLEENIIEDIETIEYSKILQEKNNNDIFIGDLITITSCIQNYLSMTNINSSSYFTVIDGEEIRLFDKKEISEQIYQILSKNYIKQNNISEQNVFNSIDMLEQRVIFIPINITKLNNSKLNTYAVHGVIEEDTNYNIIKEIKIIVNIDEQLKSFSIEPLKIDDDINNLNKTNFDESIENTEYNSYIPASATEEEIIKFYIDIYKELALGNPRLSYEYIDEDYKNNKFENIQDYISYVEKNKEYIKSINFKKYKVTSENDKNVYIIIDSTGNYITIKKDINFRFYIALDSNYIKTTDTERKYNNSTKREKVGININKIINAINQKDYRYIYNRLDNTFKSNNFNTEQELERYITNNLYEQNKVKFEDYEERDEISIYKIKVINNEKEEYKEMTIVMKLLENGEFLISFNM